MDRTFSSSTSVSKHENALPLIITHGWPGSIIEQMKVIGPLTDPTAHGASASDAFHLVIPSIPGYGYSPEPTTLGWDPIRIAKAWVALMQRLGYNQFVAQGGDWGASITQQLALFAPENVLAIHSNMPGTVPADTLAKAIANAPPPAGLAGDELHAYRQLADFYAHHLGYAVEMANRPETLYGLMDSPIGLAAWILDHDKDSYEMIAPAFFGHPGGLSRDDVLDNITMYWLTKTAISSARLYWENKLGFFNVVGRYYSGRRERVSARDLYGTAKLVGEGISQTRLLQEARRGRPLCRLGTAATLLRRRSRDVPIAANGQRVTPQSRSQRLPP